MDFGMDLKFDMTGDWSQSMSCPSSCSTSFSSGSSVAGEPFTPTSRRSTPIQFNHHQSFSSSMMDSIPYEYTSPPSSLSSAHFSVEAKPELSADMYSLTPRHIHLDFAQSMTPHSTGYPGTPTQPIDFYPGPYVDGSSDMHAMPVSPYGVPPPHTFSTGLANINACDPWAESGNSPMFSVKPESPAYRTGIPLVKQELDMSPLARKRWHMHESRVRRATTELHHVQSSPSPLRNNHGSRRYMIKKESDRMPISVSPGGKFMCTYPGCNSKKYQRNEHLKRHIKEKHSEADQHQCPCCPKTFQARADNLVSHVKLHAAPEEGKASRRVRYHKAAAPWLESYHRNLKHRSATKEKNDI